MWMSCSPHRRRASLARILSEGEGLAARACADHGITLRKAREIVRELSSDSG
jgi:hypothetical protein